MTYKQQLLLLLVFLSLPFSRLVAQSLSFADILKVYSLDSTAAKQFCTGKKLEIEKAGNTGSNLRYQFAAPDSSARLQIIYPNDSASLNVQLSYWFKNAKEYDRFRKDIRKHGFVQQSLKQVEGSVPSYVERYISKNLQIELINPGDKQPNWLFLHPVGNYNW